MSVVLARIGAFIAYDIFVKGRQITAVIFLVILAVMAQAGEHLAGIDGVQALCLVDLHSRQYRENADVVINIHRMMLALLLGEEPVPQQAVEELREIDDLPDLIFRDDLIERRKAFRCVLVVGLADRLCFADGNFENVIATGHACDDQLVIRDEHGVGVIIASVKPLLNIAFNRIHANMAFVHDAADAFAGRAAYTRTLPVSELFGLDPTDAGQNDTHKKQNIIKAVKDAHKKITAMQTAMKNALDDEKMILCEEANEVYADRQTDAECEAVVPHACGGTRLHRGGV